MVSPALPSKKLPARQCSKRLQIRTLLIHHLDVYLAFLCPIRDRFLCLQQRRGYFLFSRNVFPHLVLLLFFVFRTNNSGFQLSVVPHCNRQRLGCLCSRDSCSVWKCVGRIWMSKQQNK